LGVVGKEGVRSWGAGGASREDEHIVDLAGAGNSSLIKSEIVHAELEIERGNSQTLWSWALLVVCIYFLSRALRISILHLDTNVNADY
jgi:hypothetical protein